MQTCLFFLFGLFLRGLTLMLVSASKESADANKSSSCNHLHTKEIVVSSVENPLLGAVSCLCGSWTELSKGRKIKTCWTLLFNTTEPYSRAMLANTIWIKVLTNNYQDKNSFTRGKFLTALKAPYNTAAGDKITCSSAFTFILLSLAIFFTQSVTPLLIHSLSYSITHALL